LVFTAGFLFDLAAGLVREMDDLAECNNLLAAVRDAIDELLLEG
jgi:hypothetical protein